MTEQEQRKIFSDNLCRLMHDNGKIQADIVSQFRVSKSTASSWCSGAKLPRMSTIQNIANWLNVRIIDLIMPNDITSCTVYGDGDEEIVRIFLGAKKEPVTVADDEPSGLDQKLISMLRQLSVDQKRFLLAQIETLLKAQE